MNIGTKLMVVILVVVFASCRDTNKEEEAQNQVLMEQVEAVEEEVEEISEKIDQEANELEDALKELDSI